MRISDWSSDVCSSDLRRAAADEPGVDDLRRGAGDRADHRRLDPGLGPLDGNFLVPGRVRAAAVAGGVGGAAGNASAAPAPVAGAAPAGARLLGDLRQPALPAAGGLRSEEHTSELKSLMRTSYAVFCLKQNTQQY